MNNCIVFTMKLSYRIHSINCGCHQIQNIVAHCLKSDITNCIIAPDWRFPIWCWYAVNKNVSIVKIILHYHQYNYQQAYIHTAEYWIYLDSLVPQIEKFYIRYNYFIYNLYEDQIISQHIRYLCINIKIILMNCWANEGTWTTFILLGCFFRTLSNDKLHKLFSAFLYKESMTCHCRYDLLIAKSIIIEDFIQ